ncbi:glutamine synthetase family protein [Rothia nasisuis]|uniref:glutamine synthetase family protein n=1 Tax=Rothia nasisuis TaxID=2109647 RepID=UPI001F48356F|nr:glutamine synthetase family protein [Rothia nasisuis]
MTLASAYTEYRDGFLTLEELKTLHKSGDIDTVIVAVVDMQGRLQGKRLTSEFFLDGIYEHGTESCNYLLAVDVEMNTVPGFKISSWENGYGDLEMRPDMRTLRKVAWLERTAMVYCDFFTTSGQPVQESPRQMLITQLERLERLGLKAYVGTELEFIMFDDTYEEAQKAGYSNLTPSNLYNVDYSLLGTTKVEPLLQDIRTKMVSSGMYCEGAKGECNYGQHEITFRYQDALQSCDNHALYKNGAKEIAAQHGKSITFMAKYNQQEGSSCHIHLSFRTLEDEPVLAGDREHGFSTMMEHFIAGQLNCIEDFTYFFAPNINSYKRFVEGSFAPTAIAWGIDNRTCAVRVVGHGPGLRIENRVGGADLNPYLAVAAMIAAGIYGIENKLEMPDKMPGNAYTSDAQRLPTTLAAAREKLISSQLVLDVFGPDVVEHYAHAAQVEIEAYNATVTDWERIRGFERL